MDKTTEAQSDVTPPRRKYPRAIFNDYCHGDYFVTFCTQDRKHYLGEIRNGEMHHTLVGDFLRHNIEEISSHFDDISIPLYVIMPNHVHAIISIKRHTGRMAENIGRLNQLGRLSVATGRDPTLTTHHNSRLAVAVGSIKAAVTRFARKNNIEFAWQRRFHDHIIRGIDDGNRIAVYIRNNIALWHEDCFYS